MSSASEYMVGPIIGQGGFAHVVYAVHKHSHRKVAIKVIEQVSLRRHPWLMEAVLTEKKILQSCKANDDDNQAPSWIVELWAAFYDAQQMYFVLELCTGGDLEGLLQQVFGDDRETKSTETSKTIEAWFQHSIPFYASQLIQAVHYLHQEKKILHCDLKPGNCLLDGETGHLKLADFASAIDMAAHGQNSDGSSLPPMIPRGTSQYSCLEIIRANPPASFSEAVDYWSVGCILHAMFSNGKSPFERESEALTVQAVVDFCDAPTPSIAPKQQHGHNEVWLDMGIQLLQPKTEDRIKIWNDQTIKSTRVEASHATDLSTMVLPNPSWRGKLDNTKPRDGNTGWSAFQTF